MYYYFHCVHQLRKPRLSKTGTYVYLMYINTCNTVNINEYSLYESFNTGFHYVSSFKLSAAFRPVCRAPGARWCTPKLKSLFMYIYIYTYTYIYIYIYIEREREIDR